MGSERTAGGRRWQDGGTGLTGRSVPERASNPLGAIDGAGREGRRCRGDRVPGRMLRRSDEGLRQIEQADHDHAEGKPRDEHGDVNDG